MKNINITAFGRDINGNSIVRFNLLNKPISRSLYLNGRKVNIDKPAYSYSLQTNGNLPFTHNVKTSGLKVPELTYLERETISNEIIDYLLKYGSDKQKWLSNEK